MMNGSPPSRLTSFIDRAQGKYRRTLSAHFARRPVQLRLPRAIVSFTFDDFPSSAFHVGAPILEKFGVTGTYYVSLGLADRDGPVGTYFSESDLPHLLARGHELGCHTFDHCNAWETSSEIYSQSVIRNRQRLEQILPRASFASHSYPISYPRPATKTFCSKRFACARGGGQRANQELTDADNLAAFFVEKSRDDLPAMLAQVDRAKAISSWLIFATHDVSETPTRFGCRPELLEALVRYTVESDVLVLSVSRAFAMLGSRATQ